MGAPFIYYDLIQNIQIQQLYILHGDLIPGPLALWKWEADALSIRPWRPHKSFFHVELFFFLSCRTLWKQNKVEILNIKKLTARENIGSLLK